MSTETPFTARMRQTCDDAAERCEGHYPTRFLQVIHGCGGDLLPLAKQMLRSGQLQRGPWTLAKGNAPDVSMKAVVQQRPWCHDFDEDDLDAAAWRLKQVRHRVEAGEPPDSSDS